ncbi:sulfite exporter TauE/SafE [Oxalobacteraceae bacterium GrIS 2.11]
MGHGLRGQHDYRGIAAEAALINMLNPSLVLTALLAGLAGGSHCIGMCGGIAAMLARPTPQTKVIPIIPVQQKVNWLEVLQLHLGRLLTYAMIGAVAGSFGAAGLLLKPVLPVQSILFFVGNISLIYLGLRCLGYRPALFAGLGARINLQGFSRWFARISLPRLPIAKGLLWGCLPCGLVYGVLPIALISGSPWSGGVLMFCFGLGTLPYLLFAQGLVLRFGQRKPAAWLVVGAATILITLGCLGLFLPNAHHNAGWWC